VAAMLRIFCVAMIVFSGLFTLASAGSQRREMTTQTLYSSFSRYAGMFDNVPRNASVGSASYAAVGGRTSIPYGWLDFCGRRPEECDVPVLPQADLKLTPENWAYLDRINREVNGYIVPVSNLEHWGTMKDHWDYPVDGKGDCKIYALYKRKLLLDAGFPRQVLLMTIVRDLHNEGHAILTVKTDRGDFVLDNLVDEVRPWDATGYNFLKRQSQQNPNIWLSINLRGDASKASTDTVQARN
jgi:predicted transglutaminase-like cysteine proteinase